MASAHCVIIGAGFAGAATAYHLTRRGVTGILILEQEAGAGLHSSGRNAAMVRQVVPEASILPLARDGAAFLRELPTDWPRRVAFQQNGSLLLGKGQEWKKLSGEAERAQGIGVEAECWSPEEAREKVAVLKGVDFDGAVWCPTDGVVDIHALLAGYLESAGANGARVRYGSPVSGVEVRRGRVTGVQTADEVIHTDVLINAAGPWAATVGRMAGAVEVPLRPCRRHLFQTVPLPWLDPGWPFVWDVTRDLYFRPEAGGLLLCPCDQDEMPPGIPPVDNAIAERLAQKVKGSFPSLAHIAIKSVSAGLRTLSADGRFVIGWDPKAEGFFWVAGLGGHGVTAGSAIGSMAAGLIVGGNQRGAEEFSPARFSS